MLRVFGRGKGEADAGRRPPPGDEGFGQIGRGAELSGRLQGSGLVVVHGRVTGQIDVRGDLIVAAEGRLDGVKGRALRLRVEGFAEGELRVDGPVEVARGGTLHGQVVARRIQTSPGSVFAGALRVSPR